MLASSPAAACPIVFVANYWPRRILETLTDAEDGWHALYRDGAVRLIGRHSGPLRHVNANPTMARAWHGKRELIVVESAKECVSFRFGDKPGAGPLVFPAGFRLIDPDDQRAT
jgi:hypothetical protein